jgi:hypothetical protein
MIDTHARTRFAGLIRQLVAGLVTNDQFEDRLPQSDDPAVHEVYFAGVWGTSGCQSSLFALFVNLCQ